MRLYAGRLIPAHMNKLILGLGDKSGLLDTEPGFLLIDDGPLCDLALSKFKRAKLFDPMVHGINPLPADYRRARDLASIFYGTEGKDTLTVRNGKRALTRKLIGARRMDKIPFNNGDDEREARALVDDLLLSPLLKTALSKRSPRGFQSGASVVARINRAELGDFDAFIVGSLLASLYPGKVIISDFGFYARDFHVALVRQSRLAIGVNALAELDREMQQMVLLITDKAGTGCTYEDAETLARYAGHVPGTNSFNGYVRTVIE
jgi:hypothetical protein